MLEYVTDNGVIYIWCLIVREAWRKHMINCAGKYVFLITSSLNQTNISCVTTSFRFMVKVARRIKWLELGSLIYAIISSFHIIGEVLP